MLTIDGKQYRNLEEQVRKNKEDIQSIIDASAVLNAFGIKVVGQVDTSDKLPSAADYPGEYGDAYLVGTATPYDYYIFTRPNDTHPTAYWLNIGEFPLAGPQGETGPQGPQGPKGDGSKWYAGTQNPTIVAEVNDQYLNTTDGSVFSYSNVGWTRIGNIRGPQGVQGVQGIQGVQGNIGPVGPKGERGDVGGIVNIRGLVDNVNQLPTPTSLQNLSIAYLVGTNKELYIQIGETPETATWNNMGILNVATYVTVNGQYVNVLEMNQYQNKIRFLQLTGTSGTLTSQQINLLRSDNTNYIIVDNELYNCNDLQDANGYLVYTHTGADASNNVNIKTLSITLTNNNWSIQTTPVQPKIPVANTNEAVQFAEDERQKSKNLCCLKNESETVAGVTVIYDSINQTIELNGTSTGDINIMPNIRNILPIISNSLGKTYTFTVLKESGNFSENFAVYLGSLDSDIWSDRFTIWFDKGITVSSITFTVSTNHTYDTLFVYLLNGTVVNNLKLKVQIEEGSAATDYQPYNGAIVHEKEIADVEHIEVLYDKTSSDANINWGKTSGIYGGNVISGKDFSKYKKLIVYSYSLGCIMTTIIPLTSHNITLITSSYLGCNTGLSYDTTDLQCIKCSVNSGKTDFTVDAIGLYNTSGFSLRNETDGYFVYKIEGVY